MNRRTALRAVIFLGLVCAGGALPGCGSRPPTSVAKGTPLRCPGGGFSITVTDGWHGRAGRSTITVTRSLPYGGGYPALNVRRLDETERAAVDFDGETITSRAGAIKYRYRRWRNSRGQGYRLEALITTPGGTIYADGSVWDPAHTMDQRFFREAFWPMINSVRAGPVTQP